MGKIKLLLVEDDSLFAFVTKGSLELTGLYEVCLASNGEEGLALYEQFRPDIIVSDIEMPVLNGLEMIRKIRKKDEDVSIIFATGRTSAQDVLDGYQLGVDNFIKKPFLPDELSAHIQAVMKRIGKNKLKPIRETIYLGEYTFTVKTRTLYRESKSRKLTERESRILRMLYEKKNNLIRRDELLNELWGRSDFYTSRSLDVFISKLRKYLSNDPSIRIETIRMEGLTLTITQDKKNLNQL